MKIINMIDKANGLKSAVINQSLSQPYAIISVIHFELPDNVLSCRSVYVC